MAKKKNTSNILDDIKLIDLEEEVLDFPSICKFIRKVFNVTQEQMAQRLNASLTAYTHWEYGKRSPKSWQAVNLYILYEKAKDLSLKQENSEQQPEDISQNPQQHAA